MIASMMRHHPLMGKLPKLLGISLATASVMGNILVFKQLSQSAETADGGGTPIWLPLLILLVAGVAVLTQGAQVRSKPWFLGLPVHARNLWRAHYLVVCLALLSVVLFQWVVVVGFVAMMEALTERVIVPATALIPALVNPALLALFLGALVASYRPDLADLSQSFGWKRRRYLMLGVALITLLVVSFLPLPVGLFPAAMGALYASRARRKISQGLDLGNGLGKARGAVRLKVWDALATAPQIYRPRPLWLNLGVINQLFKIPYPYVVFLGMFVAFFTVMMAGVSLNRNVVLSDMLRLNNIGLVIYLLVALAGEFTQRLHKVDHLPVDRNQLLRYLVVPLALSVVLGYGGGRWSLDLRNAPDEKIHFQNDYGKYGAALEPGFSRLTQRGDTEMVTAPWGESHDSVARHPLPFLGTTFAAQSPYLTDGGPTSRKFLAWQFSRAVEEAYGTWIAPEELEEKYFQVNEEGEVYIPRRGFTVARDYGLKPRSGGPVAALILGPIFVIWFLVLGVFFKIHHTTRSVHFSKVVWGVMMVTLFLWHILATFNKVPGWNGWGGAALIFSTARRLGEMGTAGYVGTYGVTLLLIGLSWVFCRRMFQGVEAPRN